MSNRFYTKIGNKVSLAFDYDKFIVEDIKETFPYNTRRWDPISKEWVITVGVLNQTTVKEFLDDYYFKPQISSEIEGKSEINITAYLKKKSRKNLVKTFNNQIDELSTIIKPYPYQIEGINYMCSWDNMINGDDCGLGKSVQTIFTAEIKDNFPCLLVCPSSTKYQWKELWLKVNPNRKISIIEAGKENNWNADVIIINYDILGVKEKFIKDDVEEERVIVKYGQLKNIPWKYVVLDEIHYTKHNKTVRSKAIDIITKNVPSVHGLTGTLIENKPRELVHPLTLIKMFKEVFGTWNNFTNRYCAAEETRFGTDTSGASNTLELNRLLRETCYIRREKRDVLKDLPPLQESILNIEITNKKEYIKAEERFIDYLTEKFTYDVVDRAMMAEFLVQRNHLRQLSLKGKLKGIEEWLEDLMEQTDEKILVVGNFTEPLVKLSINFDSEIIDGSKNAQQKRELIQKWSKNKKQVMLGNISAMGTGVDGLQENCSIMVIVDLPDKPSLLKQLVSRLERIGQKNCVYIYYLLCKDTIDIKLWESLEKKREIIEAVNSGKQVNTKFDINKYLMDSYLKRV